MRLVIGGMLLAITATAMALDAPVAGTVHNTRDNGWLSYECTPVEHERLTCTLTQVSVRKKLLPSEVEAKYQSQTKQLDSEKNDLEMKELCALSSAMIDLLQGGSGKGLPTEVDVPALKEKFKGLNDMQRTDIEQEYSAAMETCRTKNMDGMKRMVRLGLEKDTRTCLVSTNRFEQTFRPIHGNDGKLLSWAVADTNPQGDCGFVQMSRFIPEYTKAGDTVFLWKYLAKRATSNPEGKRCSGFHAKDGKRSRRFTTG
jgi:hypothetical protein